VCLIHQPFHNKYSCPRSNLAILANLDINLSRRYRLKTRELLDTSIGLVPAQRITPESETTSLSAQANGTSPTPTVSYDYRPSLLKLGKQRFRFSIAPFGPTTRHSNPECDRTQTVSVVKSRNHGAPPLWMQILLRATVEQTTVAEGLTMLFNDISSDRVPRVELGQTNIILNIPHPSLLLHIHDKTSRNTILLLIQGVKFGHHIQKNESSSFRATDNRPKKTCSTPWLYHT
jgi:hypothetical protein